jgi:ppGpp synthetase/RelA/SpoT-type nucleotidyltranferase
MRSDVAADPKAWLAGQVAAYQAAFPDYRRYAQMLEEVLLRAASRIAPFAIVQSRPKSIASFAEKALRKREKYDDPLRQLTDLCGVRVIARTRSEVDALGAFIRESFDVDWANSLDCSQRLGPSEFGYRSVHYIVSLRSDRQEVYGTGVPAALLGKKAEVQVRTVVEHAYADFAHDLSYKGAFKVPRTWLRELAGVAAALEEADRTFSSIEQRLREYAASYGTYLEEEELHREIALLETVLAVDPGNTRLAARLGKLAMIAGDWRRAQQILEPFVDRRTPEGAPPAVLRDLGVAYCKRNRPGSPAFRRGQRYLEIASRPEHGDVDALCSLAGSWKKVDEARARAIYRQAFETDPQDPYALGNHLEMELRDNPAALSLARPLVAKAMERCHAHAAAGVNLPWAHYDLGKFHILMDEPYQALDAYSKALTTSLAPFMVETSLASLQGLGAAAAGLRGHEWARRLLLAGRAALFPSPEAREAVRALATKGGAPIQAPVLIVAGGTDPRVEEEMRGYADLLLPALAGFEGTVISGGTLQGVCGLVGEAARAAGARLHSVGYLPRVLPRDATPDRDRTRYREIRRTGGRGFTPLEPLQNWIDLLASGVAPTQVRVLGIGGGAIAAVEYRMALAVGARVGVVVGSGREAGRILTEAHWATCSRLLPLPPDPSALAAFLGSPPSGMPEGTRETIARAIHEAYRQERFRSGRLGEPALSSWEALREDYRRSNREQAEHIAAKLAAIGCACGPVPEPSARPVELAPAEIEVMARMEHGRWVVERLAAGWRRGARHDPLAMTSPALVGWSELGEELRELDRQAVRRIPELLAEARLAVWRVRDGDSGSRKRARRAPVGAPSRRGARRR